MIIQDISKDRAEFMEMVHLSHQGDQMTSENVWTFIVTAFLIYHTFEDRQISLHFFFL